MYATSISIEDRNDLIFRKNKVDSSFVSLRIKNRDIICCDIISKVTDSALWSIFLVLVG
jgi:hypothetical protein